MATIGGRIDAGVTRLDLPVHVDVPAERFPAEIEASAYFIVAGALTNVVKHAHADRAQVTASMRSRAGGDGRQGDRARGAAQNRESGPRRHGRDSHTAPPSQR